MAYPRELQIYLMRSAKSGLFAATSDQLPGLLTVGRSIEDIETQIVGDIQSLIKAEFNEEVSVRFHAEHDDREFLPLSEPRIAELLAA